MEKQNKMENSLKGKKPAKATAKRESAKVQTVDAYKAEKNSEAAAAGEGALSDISRNDPVNEKPFNGEHKEESRANKKKSLGIRIGKQLIKTLCLRIPIALTALTAAVLIFLKVFLTPSRVQSLLTDNFGSLFNGNMEVSVREFSPYGGFVMEGIKIYNGPNFGNSLFVSIEKLVVKYSLSSALTGNVRIPEIGIYSPRIYMTEKNGCWNVSDFIKPSDAPKEEPKAASETGDSISLPISVDVLFKFILEDFCFYVKGAGINAFVEGFSAYADLRIPPVKEIPLSVRAAALPEVLDVKVNPAERLGFELYTGDVALAPSILLSLLLSWNKVDGLFSSSFKLGTDKTPVKLQGTSLAPLNLLVAYDLYYAPSEDRLNLEHLRVSFGSGRWIELSGTVDRVSTSPYIDIVMKESQIDLKALYPYYARLTKDRSTFFSGIVSLYPMEIKGTMNNLNASGSVVLRNMAVRLMREGIDVSAPALDLVYNAKLVGSDISATALLKAPNLSYVFKGSKSGGNGLLLNADVKASDLGKRITINGLSIRFYSPQTGADAFSMNLNGDIETAGGFRGNVRIPQIYADINPLKTMLPPRFSQKLASVPLKEPVILSLSSGFAFEEPLMEGDVDMLVKVPDFSVNDLKIGAKAKYNSGEQKLWIDGFSLSSAAWNGKLTASGRLNLDKEPIGDSDLKLALQLKAPQRRRVYEDIVLQGHVDINAALKGDLDTGKASGAISIQNFSMDSESKLLSVKNVNLNFPFAYYFKARHGASLLAVEKNQVIDNDFFRQKPNFTVASLSAKHPARNISVEYLKNFEAFMTFQDNIFQIFNLKAYVMDGSLFGKRILFDIADLRQHNMEYILELDATNIDINKLDNPNQKEKVRDSELSLNANFSGRGLDINRELNLSGYVNIYKIGNDFANSLMKGLSETEGKSSLGIVQPVVDNTMSVKSFNFNLDKGLVYATVILNRKIISYLLGVKIRENRVDFERIPIQEYLRKVRGGANANN